MSTEYVGLDHMIQYVKSKRRWIVVGPMIVDVGDEQQITYTKTVFKDLGKARNYAGRLSVSWDCGVPIDEYDDIIPSVNSLDTSNRQQRRVEWDKNGF